MPFDPDVAIAVDVTWARDIPDGEVEEMGDIRIAQGPDGRARRAAERARVRAALRDRRGRRASTYGIEVVRGSTHTDADAYHLSRAGIATGLVSVPTRYIHTPTELVSLDDIENAVRLLVAFAGKLGSASLEA